MNQKSDIQKVLNQIDSMKNEIIDLTSKVVKIQSVNPQYVGVDVDKVTGGETENNEVLKPVVEGFNCKAEFITIDKKRSNLAAILKGSGGGKSLILNGHIDTVPFGDPKLWSGNDPISGKVVNNKLYGRGSTDMKGGIVSMIKALEAITKSGIKLKGDVIIQSVVGEETMSHDIGTSAVTNAGYKADAAIVTEPTDPPTKLSVSPITIGVLWFGIEIEGKPTHCTVRDELIRAGGGGDEIGVNAIEKGIKIVGALQELEQEWGITKQHPLFKPGHFTIHPGVFHGAPKGLEVPFVISDLCTIEYAVMCHPNEKVEDIKNEIETCIIRRAKSDSWLSKNMPKIEWKMHWPPAEIPQNHPIVKTLCHSHENTTGMKAQIHGFPAVCDAAWLNKLNIPSVVYGPGNLMLAHGIDEYVETNDLILSSKAISSTILNWCEYENI